MLFGLIDNGRRRKRDVDNTQKHNFTAETLI